MDLTEEEKAAHIWESSLRILLSRAVIGADIESDEDMAIKMFQLSEELAKNWNTSIALLPMVKYKGQTLTVREGIMARSEIKKLADNKCRIFIYTVDPYVGVSFPSDHEEMLMIRYATRGKIILRKDD